MPVAAPPCGLPLPLPVGRALSRLLSEGARLAVAAPGGLGVGVGASPVAEIPLEGDPPCGVHVAPPPGEPLAPEEPLALEDSAPLLEGAPLPLLGAVPPLESEAAALSDAVREFCAETEAVCAAVLEWDVVPLRMGGEEGTPVSDARAVRVGRGDAEVLPDAAPLRVGRGEAELVPPPPEEAVALPLPPAVEPEGGAEGDGIAEWEAGAGEGVLVDETEGPAAEGVAAAGEALL